MQLHALSKVGGMASGGYPKDVDGKVRSLCCKVEKNQVG